MKEKLEKAIIELTKVWSHQQNYENPTEEDLTEILDLLPIAENLLNDIGDNL